MCFVPFWGFYIMFRFVLGRLQDALCRFGALMGYVLLL